MPRRASGHIAEAAVASAPPACDGVPLRAMADTTARLGQVRANGTIVATLWRDGQQRPVRLRF